MVKLAVEERESEALRHFLRTVSRPVSSELSLTESARAAQRRTGAGGADDLPARLVEVFRDLDLWALDRELLLRAGGLKPTALRTLDAIHLATALSIPAVRPPFVSYDRRQLEAARRAGLSTASPGAEDA